MAANYTLNCDVLREAAENAGDTTDSGEISPTLISQRTGIDRGRISRHIRGISRPDLDNLIAYGRAYSRPYQDFVRVLEDAA